MAMLEERIKRSVKVGAGDTQAAAASTVAAAAAAPEQTSAAVKSRPKTNKLARMEIANDQGSYCVVGGGGGGGGGCDSILTALTTSDITHTQSFSYILI